MAGPRVFTLDPCCGTGAYLMEVLKRIHATLREREDALTAQDLKTVARERVFGFDILPGPFVVAHLQLGLPCKTWERPCPRTGPSGGVSHQRPHRMETPGRSQTAAPFAGVRRGTGCAQEVKWDK